MSRRHAVVAWPMRLPSTANLREHWAVKAKRVRFQRGVTWMHLAIEAPSLRGVPGQPREPLRFEVTLTRLSPRKLDDDNLASAFKAIRDEVALFLGIDDGSERITWRYAQEPAKRPMVRVEVVAEVAP